MALALRMCPTISLQELNAYLKALKPYYYFPELATRGHMSKVMECETAVLTTRLQNVEEGLLSFETGVSMQCCATVDNVISYFHQRLQCKMSPERERVRRLLAETPQCLHTATLGSWPPAPSPWLRCGPSSVACGTWGCGQLHLARRTPGAAAAAWSGRPRAATLCARTVRRRRSDDARSNRAASRAAMGVLSATVRAAVAVTMRARRLPPIDRGRAAIRRATARARAQRGRDLATISVRRALSTSSRAVSRAGAARHSWDALPLPSTSPTCCQSSGPRGWMRRASTGATPAGRERALRAR